MDTKKIVGLAGPAVAVAAYFIFAQPLWATTGLAVLALLSLMLPGWRQTMGLTRVVFIFCLFLFVINELGISYPYSNIFVLTGLFVLFFLSGLSWQGLYFGPGKTRQWLRPALLIGVAFAATALTLFAMQPSEVNWLGANPVPAAWPMDVLMVVGLGYATFSALMEETIFRSLIVAFSRTHLSAPAAMVAQSLLFGAMHYRAGFPSKAGGAILSLIWGLLAGWLVLKADSIYPAYLMHFVIVLLLFVGLIFLHA